MRKTPKLFSLAGLAALALVCSLLAACGGSSGKTTSSTASAKGGTYRTAVSSFGLTDNLDPTGEYQSGFAWEIYAATLRTLVSYHRIAGPAGTVLYPDLATAMPAVTDGGLTYTFHLKSGVKFSPPVSRAVTSRDILFAFQRINYAPLAAQYGFYFNGVIKGMTGQAKSMTAPISSHIHAERLDDHLPPEQAHRRFPVPLGAAGHPRADPARGGQVLPQGLRVPDVTSSPPART